MTSVGIMASAVVDTVVTPAFKTSLGQQGETVSGSTIVITTTADIAIGDLVVVRVASDNLNTTTPTFTCADSGGNTYTVHRQGATNVTANLGVAGALICSLATAPVATGGTITVTLSGARDARVAYAESFTGYLNTTRVAGNGSAGPGTSIITPGTGTIVIGDLVLVGAAIETATAPTGSGDTDTVGGAWAGYVQIPNAVGGTDNTRVLIAGQHKIVASTATQAWNITSAVSTDWVSQTVVLRKA